MTLTLELSDTVAAQLEADAHAQGRPVAQVAADALARLYPHDDTDAPNLARLPSPPPVLQIPLADALRRSGAAADAGEEGDGLHFLATLRHEIGRK